MFGLEAQCFEESLSRNEDLGIDSYKFISLYNSINGAMNFNDQLYFSKLETALSLVGRLRIARLSRQDKTD